MSSADEIDHQEAGDTFAEMAQVAASRQTEAERGAAVTYAMLAIYHELRRNDLSAKIDALALEVRKIAALQGKRAEIESGLAETVRELKSDVTAIKFGRGRSQLSAPGPQNRSQRPLSGHLRPMYGEPYISFEENRDVDHQDNSLQVRQPTVEVDPIQVLQIHTEAVRRRS